jgi:hypothetical protein
MVGHDESLIRSHTILNRVDAMLFFPLIEHDTEQQGHHQKKGWWFEQVQRVEETSQCMYGSSSECMDQAVNVWIKQ